MLIYKRNMHRKNQTSILNMDREIFFFLNVFDGQSDIYNYNVATLLKEGKSE